MTCPYLEYRQNDEEHDFDHERPYCTIADSFVSPMKADLCNDRFGFHHSEHCEIYRKFTNEEEAFVEAADD